MNAVCREIIDLLENPLKSFRSVERLAAARTARPAEEKAEDEH
jgi:hypothetical protein